MLSSVFSSGVLLLKDGKASVYGLEFDRGMQYKLGNMLSRQYEKLSKLDPEDFGLGYLTEDHQILRICNYFLIFFLINCYCIQKVVLVILILGLMMNCLMLKCMLMK